MIILDTHIWLWWVNSDTEKLDQSRIEQITSADVVAVPAISTFEVAWLAYHGRIVLPMQTRAWIEKALDGSGIKLAPLTLEIASKAVELPDHHSDPQDRIIIATALVHSASLMSSDKNFSCYRELDNKLI